MRVFCFVVVMIGFYGCAQKHSSEKHSFSVVKNEAQWKAQLSPMAYYVLRQAGTERAFSGTYDKHYKKGTYHCGGCSQPLYKSEHKYDSGSGWPSFDRAIKDAIIFDVDYKIGYARTELLCSQCGGHLGHMFSDGPKDTTGKRHCINSAALNFVAKNE
jgi:peptide-methionine (R)-S-oxide reductase